MRRALLALAFLAGLAGTARAGSLYVSPTGSDSAACSLAAPCRTIAHVQTVAQGLIASGLTQPLYNWVHAGTYQQATGLTFGAADSGTSSFPVYWLGFSGEPAPVISGGAPVTGWTLDTGSIYKAYVGTSWNFRQLYVSQNGAKAVHVPRAHGALNPAGWTATSSGYMAPNSSLCSYGNPTAIEFISKGGWSMNRGHAASFGDTGITTLLSGQAAPISSTSGPYELGMVFQVDSSCTATELGFYRLQAGDVGAVNGRLWDATHGTLLGSVTYAASSATGWQYANLSPTIVLNVGTTYITSYDSTNGFAYVFNGFPSNIDHPPLHVLAGTSGILTTNVGTLPDIPTTTNYYSDVGVIGSPSPSPVVTMQQPFYANHQATVTGYGVSATPSWIENAYELMEANSFYLNRTTGYLYLWLADGSNPANATVVAPVVDNLLTVSGASNIQFGTMQNPLVFSYSNWTGPDSATGYVGLQSGYTWTITPDFVATHGTLLDAAVTVNASTNISFNGDQFSHLGSRGLLLTGGNSNVTISNNRFDDNAGGEIQIGDANTCASVRETNIIVTNNIISAGNQFDYSDNTAIFSPCVNDSIIANNTVTSSPSQGIAIGWGWSNAVYASHTTVARNSIYDSCKEYQDCGGFYSLGMQSAMGSYATGAQLTGNYINGSSLGFYLDVGTAWTTSTNDVSLNTNSWWTDNSGTLTNAMTSNYAGCSANWYVYPNAFITCGAQPFGTPAQTVICAAGVPGATACVKPTLWPSWQSGVGATQDRPQIGP